MTHSATVRLRWLVTATSGELPRGRRFSTPARFEHQGDDWIRDAWSLVIETQGLPDAQGQQFATANFLVPNAPHDWLTPGKRFTLFEGKLALAEGVVE
jgi:hypothetical protein